MLKNIQQGLYSIKSTLNIDKKTDIYPLKNSINGNILTHNHLQQVNLSNKTSKTELATSQKRVTMEKLIFK